MTMTSQNWNVVWYRHGEIEGNTTTSNQDIVTHNQTFRGIKSAFLSKTQKMHFGMQTKKQISVLQNVQKIPLITHSNKQPIKNIFFFWIYISLS